MSGVRRSVVRREPDFRDIELNFYWCRLPDFRDLAGHPGLGRPEEAGSPSYMEGAGFPRYRTQLLLVQASGFPGLGRTSGPRTSGGSRKSELYGCDFSGIGFRISELVGRPVLGRPEKAGCPRHWFCFKITAEKWRCGLSRTVEM